MKTKIVKSIIFALAIIISAGILGNAYKSRVKNISTVEVKGKADKEIHSDIARWDLMFSVNSPDLKAAYEKTQANTDIVLKFLKQNGLDDNEIRVSGIDINKTYENVKVQVGEDYEYKNIFTGYRLLRSFYIETKKLDTINKLVSEISTLIAQNIEIISPNPEYYYSKLDSVKHDLIEKASQDAVERAKKIARSNNQKIGKIKSAYIAPFQVTGIYSNEDYTWGGVLNTSDIIKNCSVTVTMEVEIK
ncbi:MAG TPA: SIMPL domain-containing protein [Bacteroidales bacterium]|nr:SIMPL domain-containing protein [Bacteroidales bacterium]